MLHRVQVMEQIRLFSLTVAWYTVIGVSSVGIFAGLGLGATVAQVMSWVSWRTPWMASNKETLRQLVAEGLNVSREKENIQIEIIQGRVTVKSFSEIETFVIKVCDKQKKVGKTDHPPTQPLLLIHGMNTGPLYFRNILRRLVTEDVDVYVLALPGFGLVDVPTEVSRLFSSREILDFYCTYLCQVVQTLFVETKPVVVGHSFGAYLAASFYARHGDLLKQVIFVNGIGLLPFVGPHGKHWSIVFKMGVPLFFTRPFGSYLHPLLSLVVDWIVSQSSSSSSLEKERQETRVMWMFSALLLTCPTNCSDLICSRFINQRFMDSCWNLPIGGDLLGKGLNLSFVWGANDHMIRSHVAELIVNCSSFTEPKPFRLVYVSGGEHDPILWNEGKDFAEAIKHLIHRTNNDDDNRECFGHSALTKEDNPTSTSVMNLLQDVLKLENGGVFCSETTDQQIQRLLSGICPPPPRKVFNRYWYLFSLSRYLFSLYIYIPNGIR